MNQSNQTEVRFAKEYEVYGIVRSECACPPAALQTGPHAAGCPAPSTRVNSHAKPSSWSHARRVGDAKREVITF
jgi:hypothetical protein